MPDKKKATKLVQVSPQEQIRSRPGESETQTKRRYEAARKADAELAEAESRMREIEARQKSGKESVLMGALSIIPYERARSRAAAAKKKRDSLRD